jgi:hypothetical protein
MEKQVNASVFRGSSENSSVRNNLLEHQHRCSLSTLKTSDEFVRRKVVDVLVLEKMLYDRWRPHLSPRKSV